ncbi:MAG: hypothetical protein RL671_1287 [Pseudomonadota bacterium]|jgi:hypothetical protein
MRECTLNPIIFAVLKGDRQLEWLVIQEVAYHAKRKEDSSGHFSRSLLQLG